MLMIGGNFPIAVTIEFTTAQVYHSRDRFMSQIMNKHDGCKQSCCSVPIARRWNEILDIRQQKLPQTISFSPICFCCYCYCYSECYCYCMMLWMIACSSHAQVVVRNINICQVEASSNCEHTLTCLFISLLPAIVIAILRTLSKGMDIGQSSLDMQLKTQCQDEVRILSGRTQKLKVAKRCWKQLNEHNLMYIYHKQCENMQKIQ